jgi:hypothetical protein
VSVPTGARSISVLKSDLPKTSVKSEETVSWPPAAAGEDLADPP